MLKKNMLFMLMVCFSLLLLMPVAGCDAITGNKTTQDSGSGPDLTTDPGNNQDASPGDSTSIPDEYPHGFCPIYEPSTIVDVTVIKVEGITNYIIELVCKDEFKTVEAFYLELDHVTDTLRLGNVLSQVYLESKSENLCAYINIEPLGDDVEDDLASYAADGYQTFVSILVDNL